METQARLTDALCESLCAAQAGGTQATRAMSARRKIISTRRMRNGVSPTTRRMTDGCRKRQPARASADRRAVAPEKSIDRGIVIAAMEDAIQKAGALALWQRDRGPRRDQPENRRDRLSRLLLVAEQVDNDSSQISLEDARRRNPAAQVGDYIAEPLPPLEYAASPRNPPSR